MLYETYQKKINRVASILAKILRWLPVIIAGLALVIATIIGLLAAKGTVSKFYCNSQVTYGSSLGCSAKSFLSSVRYEYRALSESEWMEGLPELPGTYSVRAVGKTVFGEDRYSREDTVTILPKTITVGLEKNMEYGAAPKAVSTELVGRDRIFCEDFIIEECIHGNVGSDERVIAVMDVTPVQDKITILDENGNDVTFAYVFQPKETDVSVLKRGITIKIPDASKVYDGTPLVCVEYELSVGSILDGEYMIPIFEASLTDVGKVNNEPKITIFNSANVDVTAFYQISLQTGTLTVTKRPVSITTGSLSDVIYSGKAVSCTDFLCDPSLAPISGHTLVLASHTDFVDVGTHSNDMEFVIEDKHGNNVTENYEVTVTAGTVKILPLNLTVTTGNVVYSYNGFPKIPTSYALSGRLAEGHTHSQGEQFSFENVGVYENKVLVAVWDADGNDVTKNYDITYVYGTLTIEKRSITVITPTTQWMYSGATYSDSQIIMQGVEDLGFGTVFEFVVCDETQIKYAGSAENLVEIQIIRLSDGQDVTQNFNIDYQYGTLTVTKRPLNIQTGSQTWIYDGYGHVCLDYVLKGEFDLAPDDHFDTSAMITELTEVGKAFNVWESVIVDKDGVVVTDQYDLQMTFGELEILPCPIQIKPRDEEKVYDGDPLLPWTWEMVADSEYSVSPLHTLVATYEGSQTDAGVSASQMHSVRILDQSGQDVTANYAIQIFEGTLTVNPRPLQLKPKDETKIYDGLPLLPLDWTYGETAEYSLLPNHTLIVTEYSGSQTNAGTSDSFIVSVKIMDGSIDVTHNYEIESLAGELTVQPRPIHIKPVDEEKSYDGIALVASRWEYSNTTPYFLLDGHVLLAEYVGAQLMPGSSESSIGDVYIIDGMRDVTENYEISCVAGLLTVKDRVIGEIKTDVSQIIYLRETSYVEFDGLYGTQAPAYPKKLPGGYTYDYLTSLALANSGFSAHTAELRNMTEYLLPYYPFGGPETSGPETESDAVNGTLNAPSYSMQYYTIDIAQSQYLKGSLPSQYQANESEYRQFVYDTYLSLDSETRSYMMNIIYEQDFDLSNPQIISEIASYIQNAAKYSLDYDTKMETESNIVIAFLESYKEGVCRHYAAAATALYRALGIPARAAVGYMVETKAGEYVSIMSQTAHAWVEVYIDGIGWMQVEVTGGNGSNTEDFSNFKIGSIKTNTAQTVYLRRASYGYYDGKTYTDAPVYPKKLPGGYTYDYLTTIAIKEAGVQSQTAELTDMLYYLLPYYRGEGNYPTVSNDAANGFVTSSTYQLEYYPVHISEYLNLQGALPAQYQAYEQEYRNFVRQNYLTVDTDTRNYMYQIISEQKFSRSDPDIILKIATYIQNAAKYNLDFDRAMEQEDDVVVAFLSKYKEGVCRHYAAAATLLYRSLGIPARYTEGFVLNTTENQYVDIMTPGHAWVEVYMDGIGWMQVEVTGGYGNDEFENGVIEIKPEYKSKKYDGKLLNAPKKVTGNENFDILLEQGYTYSVQIAGSQMNIGKGESTITSFYLFDPQGNNVTDQFTIRYKKGVLEVFPENMEIIPVYLYQLQKYYDGTPLTFEEFDFDFDIPDDVRLEISLNISLTQVGSLSLSQLNENVSEYATYRVYKKSTGEDVTDSYIIEFKAADSSTSGYVPIKIERQIIKVTAASKTKLYDGTVLTSNDAYVSFGFLAEGHYMKVKTTGSIVNPGEERNVLTEVIIYDQHGNDVTANYDIKTVDGILRIIDMDS